MLFFILIWFFIRVYMMMFGVYNYVNWLMEVEDYVEQVKFFFVLF